MNQQTSRICPLCGQPNACAMVDGGSTPCWCMASAWAGQLADAVPLNTPNDQCVCAACAQRLLAAKPTLPEA